VLRRTVVSVLVVHLGGIPKGGIPGTAALRDFAILITKGSRPPGGVKIAKIPKGGTPRNAALWDLRSCFWVWLEVPADGG
jgi:hypothetical protein